MEPEDIFVFCSNLEGMHGAARHVSSTRSLEPNEVKASAYKASLTPYQQCRVALRP